MERVYTRCCGLDVHKKTVVACLRVPGARGQRTSECREVSLAAALSWAVSDADRGVTRV